MSTQINETFQASVMAHRLTNNNEKWRNYITMSNEEAIKIAEKRNEHAVYPEANQLQLDIDDNDAYQRFYSLQGMLSAFFNITDIEDHPSKSGYGHRHITITLDRPVSDIERVLLQTILGSDPKRELLSYVRLLKGEKHATLFFESNNPPQEKQEISF